MGAGEVEASLPGKDLRGNLSLGSFHSIRKNENGGRYPGNSGRVLLYQLPLKPLIPIESKPSALPIVDPVDIC